MRIVYLHQYFARPDQSGGTRSYDLAVKLAEAGHDVHMVTTARDVDAGQHDWFEESVGGITVHWLPLPYSNKMGFYERLKAFLKFAWQSGKKAIEIGGDVVFATSTPLTIAIPGVRASRKLGVPMVFEVRDLWPELPIALGVLRNPITKFLARRLERFAYSNAEQVVALSPGMAEGVSRTGYPEDKITMIPNFSNNALFEQAQPDRAAWVSKFPALGDRPIVLYAGTLGAINNVDYLIRAVTAVGDRPNAPALLVIGDGQLKEQHLELAQQLDVLDKHVFFHPPVPKRDMPSVIATSAVCAVALVDLPELRPSSPNKCFDAFAAGRPVVFNFVMWIGQVAEQAGAGLVMPSSDPQAGGHMLLEFLHDDERLSKAGANAKALAHAQFDRDQLAVKLLDVLDRAVADYGRSSKQ